MPRLRGPNSDRLAEFVPEVVKAVDTTQKYVQQLPVSWSAALKACEAMAYDRELGYSFADWYERYAQAEAPREFATATFH